MKQLVQLRGVADKIEQLGAKVVVVQREDKLRGDGLKRTASGTKVPFLLLDDFGSKNTAGYSQGSFTTYLIDSKGVVRKILSGTKTKRPPSEAIVAGLKEIS